jgi:hypothetical protein
MQVDDEENRGHLAMELEKHEMQKQINERINKFEMMLGEITTLMQEIRVPSRTSPLSSIDFGQLPQGIDQETLKLQIISLLRQALKGQNK